MSPSLVHKIARFYTLNSPLKKGRHRIAMASMALSPPSNESVVARTSDGRMLRIDLSDPHERFIYFLGEYEPPITDVIVRFVGPGDVCVDAGANIGWYTTLMQALVGESGRVHAFEASESTFNVLRENVFRNPGFEIVELNNVALGDHLGAVTLHLAPGLPSGHASLAGESGSAVEACDMITLDSYIENRGLKSIRFVKADIEGAELMMLKGASRVFDQDVPPVWVIEMAKSTSSAFGHEPNDLIDLMRNACDYEFYRINDKSGGISRMTRFGEADHGANVLCVPRQSHRRELEDLMR